MVDIYRKEYMKVMGLRSIRNFSQICGEHAVRVCQLTSAENSDSRRGLMGSWAEIHDLNKEWISRVAYGEPPDSKFRKATENLIKTYSECLADYILDKEDTKKLGELVQMETNFFNALANGRDTKQYWIAYTSAVIDSVKTMLSHGAESDSYHMSAANTIRCGVALGKWLDHVLR